MAQKALALAMWRAYPEGKPIKWKAANGHVQSGTVRGRGRSYDTLLVRNERTGRTALVSARTIMI